MKKKTCIIGGCITLPLIFALTCTVFAIRFFWNNSLKNYKYINTYTNENYSITVKQTVAQWPFGSSNFIIIAENTDTKNKKEYYGSISDDGGLGNIEVEFNGNNVNGYDATVTVNGSEMKTKIINVDFDNEIILNVIEHE